MCVTLGVGERLVAFGVLGKRAVFRIGDCVGAFAIPSAAAAGEVAQTSALSPIAVPATRAAHLPQTRGTFRTCAPRNQAWRSGAP